MEGNQQKMREALKYIVSLLHSDTFVVLNPPAMEIIAKILLASEAALSEPPRQCDVGTAEEQERRYKATGEVYHTSTLTNALAWAQTPYEAAEGAGE